MGTAAPPDDAPIPEELGAEAAWFDALLLLGFDVEKAEKATHLSFNPQMFDKPNMKGMQHVLYFLLHRANPELTVETFRTCWPVMERNQNTQFIRLAYRMIEELDAKDFILPQEKFQASHLQCGGGNYKFVRLVWRVSTLAIRAVLRREHPEYQMPPVPMLNCLGPHKTAVSNAAQVIQLAQKQIAREARRFRDHARRTVEVQEEWRTHATRLQREYEEANAELAHLDDELARFERQPSNAYLLEPTAVAERERNIRTVRDVRDRVDAFGRNSRADREVVENILGERANKIVIEGERLRFEVDPGVSDRYQTEIQSQGIVVPRDRVDLASMVRLWTLCLDRVSAQMFGTARETGYGVAQFECASELAAEVPAHQKLRNGVEMLRADVLRQIPIVTASVNELEGNLMGYRRPEPEVGSPVRPYSMTLMPPTPKIDFDPSATPSPAKRKHDAPALFSSPMSPLEVVRDSVQAAAEAETIMRRKGFPVEQSFGAFRPVSSVNAPPSSFRPMFDPNMSRAPLNSTRYDGNASRYDANASRVNAGNTSVAGPRVNATMRRARPPSPKREMPASPFSGMGADPNLSPIRSTPDTSVMDASVRAPTGGASYARRAAPRDRLADELADQLVAYDTDHDVPAMPAHAFADPLAALDEAVPFQKRDRIATTPVKPAVPTVPARRTAPVHTTTRADAGHTRAGGVSVGGRAGASAPRPPERGGAHPIKVDQRPPERGGAYPIKLAGERPPERGGAYPITLVDDVAGRPPERGGAYPVKLVDECPPERGGAYPIALVDDVTGRPPERGGAYPITLADQRPPERGGAYPIKLVDERPPERGGAYPITVVDDMPARPPERGGAHPIKLVDDRPPERGGAYPIKLADNRPPERGGAYPIKLVDDRPPERGGAYPITLVDDASGRPPERGGAYPTKLMDDRPPERGGAYPIKLVDERPPERGGAYPITLVDDVAGRPPERGGAYPNRLVDDRPPERGGAYPITLVDDLPERPPERGGAYPIKLDDRPPERGGAYPITLVDDVPVQRRVDLGDGLEDIPLSPKRSDDRAPHRVPHPAISPRWRAPQDAREEAGAAEGGMDEQVADDAAAEDGSGGDPEAAPTDAGRFAAAEAFGTFDSPGAREPSPGLLATPVSRPPEIAPTPASVDPLRAYLNSAPAPREASEVPSPGFDEGGFELIPTSGARNDVAEEGGGAGEEILAGEVAEDYQFVEGAAVPEDGEDREGLGTRLSLENDAGRQRYAPRESDMAAVSARLDFGNDDEEDAGHKRQDNEYRQSLLRHMGLHGSSDGARARRGSRQ